MIKNSTAQKVADLLLRYPVLEVCRQDLLAAVEAICECYRRKGKLLVCGNGGSGADSEHIVGELMKGFVLSRPLDKELAAKLTEVCPADAPYFTANLQGALPALSLVNQVALNTAFANDQAPDLTFAQQVLGLGNRGDVLLAISTSGNSVNVLHALKIAKAKSLMTIGLTGETGGQVKDWAEICIKAPEKATYKIQELHLPIYHALCLAAENEFFAD